ncbi:BACON domain-containing protein [Odoribacter lunatus]|uniref:BACON domain-containing protein n=1 Tax=Odoribacter lunatus TaxID=2941335 RepID=UPI002040968D|nr:BACON domain-containing protein [Odoribacter lunatus]
MKRLLYLLFLLLTISCSRNDDVSDRDTSTNICLELSQTELTFEAEGGVQSFWISAYTADKHENVEWTIVNECTWCGTDITLGYGERTVSVTVNAYSETEDRNANLLIKAGGETKVVTINQKHVNAIILSKDKFEVPQEGGNIEVEVKSNIDYEVIIPVQFQKWIKETPKSKAMTTRNFNFEVLENTTYETREGYVVFQGNTLKDTVHIHQLAGTNTLILSQSIYDISSEGATIEVELKSNIDYNIIIPKAALEWISNIPTRTERTDKICLKIEKNTTYDDRAAEIIIEDRNSTLSEVLRINQYAENTILLSCKSYRIPAKGNQISVEVKSNMEYDVLVGEDASAWIQEIPPSRGLSTNVLTLNISENTTANTRSAEILIKSKSNELSDTLRVSQLAQGEIAIYVGDIIFRTEQDLIDFSSAGYTKVQGNVWVQGLAIHSLKKLDNLLTEIDGSLNLGGGGFVTLDGLRNLEKVSGDLIVGASFLKSLEGLEKLNLVGGVLDIAVSNSGLESFEGLESLQRVGSLNIYITEAYISFLTSFKGFSKLQRIEENFELTIQGMPTTTVGATYYLALKSFEGLENLQTIGGNFKITANYVSLSSLTSFKGLDGLKTIGGSFELNVYSISTFNVSSLTGLESFKGLENLESIGGNFKITASGSSLNSLDSFKGLSGLQSIGGNFELASLASKGEVALASLKSFKGLENLQTISGNLKISGYSLFSDESSNLTSFTSFSGLENLENIGEKKLEISYLDALNNIDALHNIKALNDISITGCSNLYDFCALKNAIQNMNSEGKCKITFNGYNPTKEQLLNGECSKPIEQGYEE